MTFLELQNKTRLLLGNITTTQYSATNLKRSLNDHYNEFILRAILANPAWEVSGEIATADLVQDQREYVFPTDLVAIKAIEVNMTGNTDGWVKVGIIDHRTTDFARTNYEDTADRSSSEFVIELFDASIFFLRPPSTNVTNGLKIYYNKDITEMSADADLASIPKATHMGLVYGACMDYCIETEQRKRIVDFKTLLDEKISECVDYYTKRMPIVRPRITTRSERYF